MAYVALSRVTTSKGLFLIEEDFNTTDIYCNVKLSGALTNMPSARPLWSSLLPPLVSDNNDSLLVVSHNIPS